MTRSQRRSGGAAASREQAGGAVIDVGQVDAVVFDMDGVITDTASTHLRAWRRAFDEHLAQVDDEVAGAPFTDDDYRHHVDGRARIDGVTSFLASRGLALPVGRPTDEPSAGTAWGLANRKDALFQQALTEVGAHAYPTSLALVRELREAGVRTAVVTASRNRSAVLASAGAEDLFEVAVDGRSAATLSLPGKPEPAMYLEAARQLGVPPARAVVVEDALSGVEAGRRGGFGLVIGVARNGSAAEYLGRGADTVVTDLAEIRIAGPDGVVTDSALWCFELRGFVPEDEGHREALCTLGNGVFGTRGAAPESHRDEVHYPGTYAAGLFNRLVTDLGDRRVEHESMVNLPNWLCLTVRAEDGPWLDPGEGDLLDHEQVLDVRCGLLRRRFRWRDADGRITSVEERRLVSMADPHLGALEWVVVPENWSGRLTVRSGLDGRVENRNVAAERHLAGRHLQVVRCEEVASDLVLLVARTTQSQRLVAEVARTRLAGTGAEVDRSSWGDGERIGHDLCVTVEQGRPVVVEKVVALFTSLDPAISEPGVAAQQEAADAPSFPDLLRAHEQAWRHLWRRCHLRLGCEERETGRALNLHIFHVLQTVSPHIVDRGVGMPARGLHGEGYRGHIFWDELFVFPFLNLRFPQLTRELLLYRHQRLPAARRAARAEGRRGALYPWQSGSDGREETPTELFNTRSSRWMRDSSRRQRHVSLAIAYNIWQYHEVTGDVELLVSHGAELLVEIARYWVDLASFDEGDGRYHLRGVMGPDEFHDGYPDRPGEGVDDNAYTNVLVTWLLRRVQEVVTTLRERDGGDVLERLGVTESEVEEWEHVSRRLHVPFLGNGLIAQFEGYDELEAFDWEAYRQRYGNIGRLDLILEAEGDTTNRYQLSKQADALMLFYLLSAEELCELFDHLGLTFDPGLIPETIDHYLARSADGSTLSRVAHAWVLSRSDRRRSWWLFKEALASDLDDIQGGTTQEGIHVGAMAGSIDLVQRCYTGISTRDGVLWLNPRLPEELTSLELSVQYRKHWLDVEVSADHLRVTSRPTVAPPILVGLVHEVVELRPGASVGCGVTTGRSPAVDVPAPPGGAATGA